MAGTAALALIPGESWMLLLICYTISTIGFAGSNVFYDAFLVDVAAKERMNMVSARGLGWAISAVRSLSPQHCRDSFSTSGGDSAVRPGRRPHCLLITAAWWGLFSIPLLLRVRQRYYIEREPRLVLSSFKRLAGTLRQIRKHRALFLFLLAYFFYIDGVGTIITMSTSYGADLGISAANLLIVLFVTQVVAAPFSILYGRLAERFKGKTMLYAGIGVYMIVCTYAYFMDSAFDFWVLAMLVATSQGGIQALSRSYFAKLVPKQNANEFFGFYNIFGKFASIIGPLLIAVTAQLTGNSSAAVFSLIILFVIGIGILAFVPEETA
ncbi:MFS transporter [Bacillus velezensis]|nr:MFS transporter [Bacillus velezensis]